MLVICQINYVFLCIDFVYSSPRCQFLSKRAYLSSAVKAVIRVHHVLEVIDCDTKRRVSDMAPAALDHCGNPDGACHGFLCDIIGQPSMKQGKQGAS